MSATFDFVVVGAGPGGCAVAAGLARGRPDLSVALLESGGGAPVISNIPLGICALVPLRSPWNYGFETTPQPGLGGRRGFQPRGRGLGGSSLINAMIYTRGHPADYDGWAAEGCEGWAWKEVLPWFRKGEDNERGADDWHGVGGPLHVADLREKNPATRAFVDAALQAGFTETADFNGPSQEGVGAYQVFQKIGRRFNAARAYLADRPRNLTVVPHAQALQVLFDGRRATGVVCAGGVTGERRFDARREVVLSGGAFGTPQLLMLSGVGPGDHLKSHGIRVVADAPGVGANLQDHIDYTINVAADAPGLFGLTLPVFARGPWELARYLARGRGMLTTNAAEGGGFVKSGPDVSRPDLQLHFCIGMVDDHNRTPHFEAGYALHVCVLHPKSRGTVRLQSRDVRDAPLIDPRFLSEPEDMDTLVKGARIAQSIIRTPALADMGGRALYGGDTDDETELRARIRERADTIYHPVGTCRMGADAASVVDLRLRVRGVEGLRVADASIMPRLIGGNTEAPTAMIGERAAAMILEEAR